MIEITFKQKGMTTPEKPREVVDFMVRFDWKINHHDGPYQLVRDGKTGPPRTRAEAKPLVEQWANNAKAGDKLQVNCSDTTFYMKGVEVVVYKNPLRKMMGLVAFRQDMGVDYGCRGDSIVYSPGPGVVRVYQPTNSGWPLHVNGDRAGAYINIEFTDGIARGKFWYDAENITLKRELHVGSIVTADTVIAVHHPGYAYCEMGWAAGPLNQTLASATSGYTEGQRTAAGNNASKFLVALGAPAGLTEGRPISGSLPVGWPTRWRL